MCVKTVKQRFQAQEAERDQQIKKLIGKRTENVQMALSREKYIQLNYCIDFCFCSRMIFCKIKLSKYIWYLVKYYSYTIANAAI